MKPQAMTPDKFFEALHKRFPEWNEDQVTLYVWLAILLIPGTATDDRISTMPDAVRCDLTTCEVYEVLGEVMTRQDYAGQMIEFQADIDGRVSRVEVQA